MHILLPIIEEFQLAKYLMVNSPSGILKRNRMAKIKIKQIKSKIGSTLRQKRTLEALGLRKINCVVELEGNPQILGMVEKVRHLVTVEEI